MAEEDANLGIGFRYVDDAVIVQSSALLGVISFHLLSGVLGFEGH